MMSASTEMNGIVHIRYVLLMAFVIRLVVPLFAAFLNQDLTLFHSPDTSSYVNPAKELISSWQFDSDGTPEIERTPGYPLLLIPGIILGSIELVTIAVQIILSCLTVYLVFKIALLLFERHKIAVLCALLYSVEPLSILYTSKLLTETSFTCMTVLFLYFLLQYLKTGSLGKLLVASFALCASVYIRPISYFLPVITASILLCRALAKTQIRSRPLFHACLFVAVAMSLIALWQIRNKVETGYSGFSAITDTNLYFYQGASVLAVQQGVSFYEMQDQMGYRDREVYFANHPEQRSWSQGKRYQYMRKQGIKILTQHPSTYLRIHLKGMLRTLLEPGATEYLKLFKLYPESGGLLGVMVDKGISKLLIFILKERPLVFWSNVLLGLILGFYLFFAGITLLWKKLIKNISVITLLTVGVYFLIISGGPHSYGRFRHSIMPILCVLSGYGLVEVSARFRKVIASRNLRGLMT